MMSGNNSETNKEPTEKFDWLSTIETNTLLLRVTGLWPRGESYKCDIYTIYSAIIITVLLLADVLTGLINITFLLNDMKAATAALVTMASKVAAVFKVYYFIKNIETLKNLMKVLMSDTFQPKNSEQRKLVQPSLDTWTVAFKMLCVACSGSVISWSIYPLLNGLFKKYKLPFEAWYPYDVKKSPIYELTYVYQVVALAFLAVIISALDSLIAALNTFVATQLDLLCNNLRNLHILSTEDGCVNDKLIKCIKHHKQILSFAETSNNFFNFIIFFQFFMSAIVLGINLFQLTVVEPFSSEFYSFLNYENGTLVELFVYCWFGNEVQIKSENVSYAVFESDWMNFSPDVKKNIIFFVTRCQRPMKISAFKLFYLSLDTFTRILRAGYSSFAFLYNVNNS